MTRYLSATRLLSAGLLAVALSTEPAQAHDKKHGPGEIKASADNAELATFDVVHAKVTLKGGTALFHMHVSGTAGEATPQPVGETAGSDVFAYVWPTSLDPSAVGFPEKSGVLALAVTAHPDFDDTPLYDENRDGDLANDGNEWHSHWVVLTPDETREDGALKVVDIPKGAELDLPATWPGLPLLLDSPGYTPILDGQKVEVAVPAAVLGNAGAGVTFDAVTAGLKVNANLHAPLLRVTNVFDIASGDLSLPGQIIESD